MYTGLLHLHSVLRWVILIMLIWNLVKLWGGKNSLGISKILLISAHTTLLIGLYQYFFGAMGFKLFSVYGAEVMKQSALRFWAVEHMVGMIAAIALITVGHVSLKKTANTKKTAILYTIALVLVLVSIPWPFREGIGRALFPGH